MRQNLILFILIILFSCSQEEKKKEKINLKTTLLGQWIYRDYFNSLPQTKSPYLSKGSSFPLIGFYYYPSDKYSRPRTYDDKVLEIININGSIVYSYYIVFDSIKNEIKFKNDNIEIDEKNVTDFSLSFKVTPDDTLLLLKYKIENIEFNKEYVKAKLNIAEPSKTTGFDQFIHENTIAGIYLNKSTNDTIIFEPNSSTKGFKDDFFYHIELDFPKVKNNFLSLYSSKKDAFIHYYWSHNMTSLTLTDTLNKENIELEKIKTFK